MMGLTPRQADCARAIEDLTARLGYTPSLDELRQALGLKSRSNVHRLVAKLRERGWLEPAKKYAERALVMTRPAPRAVAGTDCFEITDAGRAAMADYAERIARGEAAP
jgi:SOS-response transcriptional repressor LexA